MSKNMFDMPFDEFANTVTQMAVKTTSSASRDFLGQLTGRAPVDTSRFVSNMNVSLDVPDNSHDNNKFIGERGAYAAGAAVINVMRPNVLQSVYIVNTISYGMDLETNRPSPKALEGTFYPSFLAVALYYAN